MEPTQPLNLVLLLPVYNDWQCAQLLIAKLDEVLTGAGVSANIILLDDSSTVLPPRPLLNCHLRSIGTVKSLRLQRNLGHQRAIAIGLCFVQEQSDFDAALVMDADGEDKPEDVPKLIERYVQLGGTHVVFAERARRSEHLTFRLFYQLYRLLHRVLTGIAVKVGNFSILSRHHIATLSVVSELWNHYAASVFKARLPITMLATTRGKRLAGESKLNFVNLVIHGLSAISVFADTVGVRLMLAIGSSVVLSLLLVALVIAIRAGTAMAIPGWATSAVGLLLIIVLQMLTLVVGLTFSVLFNRNSLTFLPVRDYRYFIGEVSVLYARQ